MDMTPTALHLCAGPQKIFRGTVAVSMARIDLGADGVTDGSEHMSTKPRRPSGRSQTKFRISTANKAPNHQKPTSSGSRVHFH